MNTAATQRITTTPVATLPKKDGEAMVDRTRDALQRLKRALAQVPHESERLDAADVDSGATDRLAAVRFLEATGFDKKLWKDVPFDDDHETAKAHAAMLIFAGYRSFSNRRAKVDAKREKNAAAAWADVGLHDKLALSLTSGGLAAVHLMDLGSEKKLPIEVQVHQVLCAALLRGGVPSLRDAAQFLATTKLLRDKKGAPELPSARDRVSTAPSPSPTASTSRAATADALRAPRPAPAAARGSGAIDAASNNLSSSMSGRKPLFNESEDSDADHGASKTSSVSAVAKGKRRAISPGSDAVEAEINNASASTSGRKRRIEESDDSDAGDDATKTGSSSAVAMGKRRAVDTNGYAEGDQTHSLLTGNGGPLNPPPLPRTPPASGTVALPAESPAGADKLFTVTFEQFGEVTLPYSFFTKLLARQNPEEASAERRDVIFDGIAMKLNVAELRELMRPAQPPAPAGNAAVGQGHTAR